jgi:hypothetical protein
MMYYVSTYPYIYLLTMLASTHGIDDVIHEYTAISTNALYQ